MSLQGSGVLMHAPTERPVGLRPYIERAFEQPDVSIDFAGFSGETLHGVLQEPLDNVRAGRLTPRSITIRALVPDTSQPLPLPCRVDDLGDDPRFRERSRQIMLRNLPPLIDTVQELTDLGLVEEAIATVRTHGMVPMFKLYVLNGEDAFFGFYPVQEHAVTLKGEKHSMYDLMGKDAVLFHHALSDDNPAGAPYVEQARTWFDGIWNTVARDLTP